jgi:hypothetical protein
MLFRSLIEIDALRELLLDAAELEAPVAAELLPELLEVPQR